MNTFVWWTPFVQSLGCSLKKGSSLLSLFQTFQVFAGLKKDNERSDLINYIETESKK